MNRLSQGVVLVGLARRLYEQGSWTGETHIQKAAYLLHELLAVRSTSRLFCTSTARSPSTCA